MPLTHAPAPLLKTLFLAGADVGAAPASGVYNGIPVDEWPRVVLAPSFAATLADVKVCCVCDW